MRERIFIQKCETMQSHVTNLARVTPLKLPAKRLFFICVVSKSAFIKLKIKIYECKSNDNKRCEIQ
jgi:hypothetical protein